jgi:hypothetical protein
LKQERYANEVVSKFLPKKTTVATPMSPGTVLCHEGEPLPEDNAYAAIVGSLLYLAVKTRPDIAHAVGVLARFMSCPRVPHLKTAINVLRYVARDPGAGIKFCGCTGKKKPVFAVAAYSDADFGGDLVMRKSTSGLLCVVNGAPVLWKSKLQSVVAQSTAEAEFVAASMAVKEVLWLHKLLHVLMIPRQTITLFCDNESALRTMSGAKYAMPGRVKHIDVQYWGICDHVMKGNVLPKYIASEEMLADCFTKPYSGPAAKANMLRIGMCVGTTQ